MFFFYLSAIDILYFQYSHIYCDISLFAFSIPNRFTYIREMSCVLLLCTIKMRKIHSKHPIPSVRLLFLCSVQYSCIGIYECEMFLGGIECVCVALCTKIIQHIYGGICRIELLLRHTHTLAWLKLFTCTQSACIAVVDTSHSSLASCLYKNVYQPSVPNLLFQICLSNRARIFANIPFGTKKKIHAPIPSENSHIRIHCAIHFFLYSSFDMYWQLRILRLRANKIVLAFCRMRIHFYIRLGYTQKCHTFSRLFFSYSSSSSCECFF